MERINWIDWAKAIAITMVVFGHLPMEGNNYLLRYITTFHMPLFFFISGFLTKTGRPIRIQISKNKTSLIWPYVIYNIIFYPYWLIRYYIDNGHELGPTFEWTIKPFLGVILLQHESSFSCSLNGVTWFIAALLFMKVILEIANKCKYSNFLLFLLSVICIIGYTTNEQIHFTKCLTPIGFMKCFPFYILAYKMKNYHAVKDTNFKNCSLQVLGGFSISTIAFIASRHEQSFITLMFLFYIISTCAICFVLAGCRQLNGIKSIIIENLSNGTLMLMGLHWMAIGTINYFFSKLLFHENPVVYSTFQGILLCIFITVIIYFLITWSIKHAPLLIGKHTQKSTLES